MKKSIYSLLSLFGLLCLSACSDYTDLDPKGNNLLKSVDDLEMLLNYEYSNMYTDEMHVLAGDLYPFELIPNIIAQPQKSISSILITWDEEGHAKEQIDLTASDSHYTRFYYFIGRIANPILMNIDKATGDDDRKLQIKCEALVMRAYFHYLLVQKFAKAYDPSYASQTLAIPYLLESQNILATIPQLTLEEVYTNIINDLNDAISLGGLPEKPVNHMRMSLPFAYAVKALALMSMQDFDGAADAASSSIAINPTMLNYNDHCTIVKGLLLGNEYPVIRRPFMDCAEDLFVVNSIIGSAGLSTEASARFEEGHICHDRILTYDLQLDYTRPIGLANMGIDIPAINDTYRNWNNFGVKTSQMYLVLAECAIHNDQIDPAMGYLDQIRENRIIADKYAPLKGTVTDKADAIKVLKQTSHGENIYTYFNFVERKRWNRLPDFKETLTRTIDGKTYTLSPDSPLWIFPFPKDVTSRNPSIKQNY